MSAHSNNEADRIWAEAVDLADAGKIDEAIARYLTAARMGHVAAQSNLANLLDDEVVPARPHEAVYWYKRAIRGGSAVAAWNLAMHYRNQGKLRWYFHWLRVAAQMGEEDAATELRMSFRLV